MTTYYQYRIYCVTDGKFEYSILPSTYSTPTICPTNTAHTINSDETVILKTIKDDMVTIKEENIPTGGNFGCRTVTVNAVKNTTSTKIFWFPYPVSALNIDFVTGAEHNGDHFDLTIGENTITGALAGNVNPASAWSAQNYVVGDTVTYTHPTFGSRVYTCMVNTVSNEIPTDTTYWKHGFEISVSQTVIDNGYRGYHYALYDGVNRDELGCCVDIDTINNKLYMEISSTNSFSAASPTYVQQTVFFLKAFALGKAWEYDIGASKIGGSYIPADTLIKILYTNNSTLTDKTFIGRVEYLY